VRVHTLAATLLALTAGLLVPAAALASGARALELQPGMLGVHANLGNALRDLGRAPEALAQ